MGTNNVTVQFEWQNRGRGWGAASLADFLNTCVNHRHPTKRWKGVARTDSCVNQLPGWSACLVEVSYAKPTPLGVLSDIKRAKEEVLKYSEDLVIRVNGRIRFVQRKAG